MEIKSVRTSRCEVFMKKILLLLIAAALTLGGLPSGARALSYSDPGAVISGDCGYSVQAPSKAGLQAGLAALDTAFKGYIETMQDAVVQAIVTQTEANSKIEEKKFNELVNSMNERDLVHKKHQLEENIANRAKGYCEDVTASSAAASGFKAAEKARTDLNRKVAETGDGTYKSEEEAKTDIQSIAIQTFGDEIPNGNHLFPENGYYVKDQAKVNELARLITDPYPNPEVSETGSRSGVQAFTEQRVKQAGLAAVIDAFNYISTMQGPGTQMEGMKERLIKNGLSQEDADKYLGTDNMTSKFAVLKAYATHLRFLNPNWHTDVDSSTMPSEKALNEIMKMMSVSMAIQMERFEVEMRIMALLATQTAMEIERSNGRVQGNLFQPGVSSLGAGGGASPN